MPTSGAGPWAWALVLVGGVFGSSVLTAVAQGFFTRKKLGTEAESNAVSSMDRVRLALETQIDRLRKEMETERKSFHEQISTLRLEVATVVSRNDVLERALVTANQRADDYLDTIISKLDTAASSRTKLAHKIDNAATLAAGVADDLAAAHIRADEAVSDDPGSAADASAKSPPHPVPPPEQEIP